MQGFTTALQIEENEKKTCPLMGDSLSSVRSLLFIERKRKKSNKTARSKLKILLLCRTCLKKQKEIQRMRH